MATASINRKYLEDLCDLLNRETDNRYGFSVGMAYGRPRLEANNGSRDVSPRLNKRELADWMHAFAAGLDHAIEADYIGKRL